MEGIGQILQSVVTTRYGIIVSCSNAMIFRCFGLILLVGLDFNTSIGGLVSRELLLVARRQFISFGVFIIICILHLFSLYKFNKHNPF